MRDIHTSCGSAVVYNTDGHCAADWGLHRVEEHCLYQRSDAVGHQ